MPKPGSDSSGILTVNFSLGHMLQTHFVVQEPGPVTIVTNMATVQYQLSPLPSL